MPMPMVGVREMGVSMRDGVVMMPMRVSERRARDQVRLIRMLMSMMFIVNVLMEVIHRFMAVRMRMAFG